MRSHKVFVFTRNCEFCERLAIARYKSATDVIETEFDLVADNFHVFVERTGIHEAALAIGFGQSPKRKTTTYFLFVPRVYVFHVANVRGDGHAGVRNCKCCRLRLPDSGQFGIVSAIIVGRKLNEIERHLGIVPYLAPPGDERLHLFVIKHSLTVVRLTLIPKRATDCEGHERMHHAVVEGECGLEINLFHGVALFVLLFGELRKLFELVREIFFQRRHGLITCRRNPWLNARAAPVTSKQTNRHVEFLFQIAGIEITDRCEFADGF